MTITGFKSTDIETRSKVEPATVTRHGYKRTGVDVNTFVGYINLGTSVSASDSTLSEITLVSLPSGIHVGCLAATTQSDSSFIEIIAISGNTITLGRNLPSVYSAFQNVIIYKPILLTADSTGKLFVSAAVTSLPGVVINSVPYAADLGNPSSPTQAVQLGMYDPNFGGWLSLPVSDPYSTGVYSISTNIGGGYITLVDSTGAIIASSTTTPGASDRGIVTRNIPSGEQDIAYADPVATTGNITANGQTVSVALAGMNNVTFSIRGTYGSVAIIFEASLDGTNWGSIQACRLDSNTIETASGTISNTARAWECSVNNMHSFRVRATAWASGTANIQINASFSATEPIPAIASHAVTLASTTITSLVPGTSATTLGKAIDSVPGATDTGVALLAQRDDTPVTLGPANKDYFLLRGNSLGQLWTASSTTRYRDAAGFTAEQSIPNGYALVTTRVTAAASTATVINVTLDPTTACRRGDMLYQSGGTFAQGQGQWAIVDSVSAAAITLQSPGFGVAPPVTVSVSIYRPRWLLTDSNGNLQATVSGVVQNTPISTNKVFFEAGVLDFSSITNTPTVMYTTSNQGYLVKLANTSDVELCYSIDSGNSEHYIPADSVDEWNLLDMGGYFGAAADIYISYPGTAPTRGRFSFSLGWY